jgi:tetratricopeptide (TPR) repeat protein
MQVATFRPLAAALLVLLPLAGCGGGEGESGGKTVPAQADDAEAQRLRELAAAYYDKESIPPALEALQPLLERDPPDPRDLIAAACIELKQANSSRARELLERARELGDDSDALHYNLARADFYDGDFARAATRLESLHRRRPDDLATLFLLAQMHEEIALEDGERGAASLAQAERHYQAVRARGIETDASRYVSATFRLGQLLERSGRSADAAPLHEEYERLSASGLKAPPPALLEEGTLGRLSAPAPQGNRPSPPGPLPEAEDARTIVAQAAGMADLLVADLDDDCRLDLVLWGPAGLAIALQGDGFSWSWTQLVAQPVERALAFDVDNDSDGDLDLLYTSGSTVGLLRGTRAKDDDPKDDVVPPVAWTPWERAFPELPSAPRDLLAVDFDHEGDLDLLLVGDFGARLWRNDGAGSAAPEGLFVDATAQSGLPTRGEFTWCLIEDFDTDQDVDFLLGGAGTWYLASSLRGGKFEDKSAWIAGLGGAEVPLLADLDGDARPDLWDGRLHAGLPGGGLRVEATGTASTVPARGAAARFDREDLDLNGSLDAYWLDAGMLHARLSIGLPDQTNVELALGETGVRRALFADLDGDLAQDLLILRDDALELRRGAQPGNAVRLLYRGGKDNRLAVGAVVELRAGGVYRRLYSLGGPLTVGVGSEPEVDYVRVLWPNGVQQYDLRHKLGNRACDKLDVNAFQPSGVAGSCPFLYTWNGREYEFITDVLGITPLGLPMAPGLLVPPDHDEYVLVKAEQWAARDGFYELQFTEELREVTYLDRIRLDAIDHPAGTEVFPNERFCFPPFPDEGVHLIAAAHAPRSALGSDGRDWAAELAEVDSEFAAPFEAAPSQLAGLATPHTLELAFDPALTANAAQLRLVLTGWFFWTDASVNMSSARHPDWEFVPPILQVPDGQGGWRDAGPPVGFPAGKTKSMVLDVTGIVDPADPRLRLFSTLRLYWDQIRLSTDSALPPIARHSVEPAYANLWRRGFSAPEVSDRPHQPERFDWHALERFPRWNPHPGRCTKLGDVLPLLGEIDDRFVILASGDALTVRFPAAALPPLPEGWRRDFLVFLDGWAKDRDPNTLEAEFVEPLPFHGMSGYPYGPGEHFPDTPEHQAWRREWNTRDAQPWIPFQAPAGRP